MKLEMPTEKKLGQPFFAVDRMTNEQNKSISFRKKIAFSV